jgi:hypothetical protein
VSSLDPTSGINVGSYQVPGLKTRRSQSVLEMHDGDNFVLSGLYNRNLSDTYNKTPILGQIPVLGALFRSRAYQDQKTELVIVIHPEVLSQMNLSAVESYNAAHQKISRLDPGEVFKELKESQQNDQGQQKQSAGQLPNPVTVSEKPDHPLTTLDASSFEGKSPQEIQQMIQKEQKSAQALSKQIEGGNIPPGTTSTTPSTGERTVTISGAAAPVVSESELKDALNSQGQQLNQLINSLNATVVTPVEAMTPPLPEPNPSNPVQKLAALKKSLPAKTAGKSSPKPQKADKVSEKPTKEVKKTESKDSSKTSAKPEASKKLAVLPKAGTDPFRRLKPSAQKELKTSSKTDTPLKSGTSLQHPTATKPALKKQVSTPAEKNTQAAKQNAALPKAAATNKPVKKVASSSKKQLAEQYSLIRQSLSQFLSENR